MSDEITTAPSSDENKSYHVIPAGKEYDPHYYVPPYDKDTELEPNYFCRARNVKREKYCRAKAGQGTDHLGHGRCKNHGGSTPIEHGRYSDVARGSVGEHIDRLMLESEAEKLDTIPEAVMLRGLAMNYIEKYQEFYAAIMKYNEVESKDAAVEERKPKFLSVPSLEEAATLVKTAADVINNVHKQRAMNAITLRDFNRLMGQMAAIVSDEVRKLETLNRERGVDAVDKVLEDIGTKWREIKLKAI